MKNLHFLYLSTLCNVRSTNDVASHNMFTGDTPGLTQLGCPPNWLRAGHKCYFFNVNTNYTWQNASTLCQQRQSTLINIQSQDERVWSLFHYTQIKIILAGFFWLLNLNNKYYQVGFILFNVLKISWRIANRFWFVDWLYPQLGKTFAFKFWNILFLRCLVRSMLSVTRGMYNPVVKRLLKTDTC